MTTIKTILKKTGRRCCPECGSLNIEYFLRVYIKGEIFSFPYCKDCGLVQWKIVPGFHLTLEKLYEVYMELARIYRVPNETMLEHLQYIKKRKGDEGFSDDKMILEEIFRRH